MYKNKQKKDKKANKIASNDIFLLSSVNEKFNQNCIARK